MSKGENTHIAIPHRMPSASNTGALSCDTMLEIVGLIWSIVTWRKGMAKK
jgi:hypothetical protein